MDENLNQILEENEDVEIREMDIPTEDVEPDVPMEEMVYEVTIEPEEDVVIDISESMGWVSGDNRYHDSLLGIDFPKQHPITAITNLREELDEIERLKTVYSDKKGVADYYEWADGHMIGKNGVGYFVSLNEDASTISICTGEDIFGVVVFDAAFVGGQDNVARGDNYGLVVTSGAVLVRCELDVVEGDCVISNSHGKAEKSNSNCGYRVIALHNIGGESYATINLNITADQINSMGANLQELDSRLDIMEPNIVSAINVANQAYQKAADIDVSNKVISDKVDDALDKVDNMTTDVENMGAQVSNSVLISAQAKAIAESAITSAESIKNEAVSEANNALAQIKDLADTLEPLTTWTDPETGSSGASYLVDYIDNGLATKAEIETVEDDLEHSLTVIQKNAKSLQSLVATIDKYSVGEYSMAYGLTLDQATSILENGIIYVPTSHENLEAQTSFHKEKYIYVEDGTTYEYEREFVPGYLYQWGVLSNGRHGWITIDKNYNEVDDVNTSAPSVYFSAHEITIGANDDYGYWYTDADTVYDINGDVTDVYEPHTLYKWEGDHWFAVATLAGNSQNRSISQVRQTATSIEASVTDMKGDVAASKTWIEDNSANVQDVVTWKNDNDEAIATTIQSASDSEAYIAQIASVKNEDGTINAIASIVTAVNEDESSVGINADRIVMTGTTTFLKPDDVGENGTTVISGSRITTGELDAEKVKVINLQASNIIVTGNGNQTVDQALANTLVSSTIYYALSTSTKTPPADEDWSEVAPEKERKKYMWQKTVNVYGDGSSEEKVVCIAGADGEGAIVVDIKSSTGTIYVNNDIKTTLIAKVYQDNQDITDEFPDSAFLWEKYDMYGTKDTVWSYTGKTVAVSNLDIYKRAMFNCVLDVEQRIEKEDIE